MHENGKTTVPKVLPGSVHVANDLELLLLAAGETLTQRLRALVAPLGYRTRMGCEPSPKIQRRQAQSGSLALCAAPGLTEGLAFLRELSSRAATRSICILTEDHCAETGSALLNAGADLWLPIHMAPQLLRAFVVATARRLKMRESSHGAIDGRAHAVSLRDWTARLTQTEFKVFEYLCAHSHRWVPEPELRKLALNKGYHSSDSLVRVHIRGIRRALGPHRECLRSTRQLGYRISFDEGAGEENAVTA